MKDLILRGEEMLMLLACWKHGSLTVSQAAEPRVKRAIASLVRKGLLDEVHDSIAIECAPSFEGRMHVEECTEALK